MSEAILTALLAGLAGLVVGLSRGYVLGKEALADLLWASRRDRHYCPYCARAHLENGGHDDRPPWCPNVEFPHCPEGGRCADQEPCMQGGSCQAAKLHAPTGDPS